MFIFMRVCFRVEGTGLTSLIHYIKLYNTSDQVHSPASAKKKKIKTVLT